jgi:putative transcriptional regulator
MSDIPAVGRLLVATPLLGDPNFDGTVVLLLAHGPDGTLGVVLNRPTEVEVGGALPGWSHLAAEPTVVFRGGPVSPTSVICLGRGPFAAEGGDDDVTTIVGDVGVVDLERDPDELAADIDGLRLFAGYSGWDGGQLEDELEAGAWFVVDTVPDDALTAEPTGLWRRVLRRQRGDVALFSQFPEKPELN